MTARVARSAEPTSDRVGDGKPGPAEAKTDRRRSYFAAVDATGGNELWRSNGTSSGIRRVKDIRPGGVGSSPGDLLRLGSTLYFAADGTLGVELRKGHGSSGDTRLVKDISTHAP